MKHSAPSVAHEDAADAVKAYVRMNRAKLALDGELLALLLPERFDANDVRDMQRFIIERLTGETAKLRAERDALLAARDRAIKLGEGVRRAVLDLVDARSFEEAIDVAMSAAPAFGAVRAALCVESDDGVAPTGTKGVRLIPPGTIAAILGSDGMLGVLAGGGELLLGPGGDDCRSVAIFRLRIGRDTPAALYVLGATAEASLESDEAAADLGFFARALERAIRAWLDLPKL
ncbi:MAG TPA: DUF484 family protein [Rhizomicrobium sp.]|nr:DUF484 family protein [Rhizomicrobium sp.]